MSLDANLAAALPNLSTSDSRFATSLLASASRWTARQIFWAKVLAERAKQPQTAPEVINVEGIVALPSPIVEPGG